MGTELAKAYVPICTVCKRDKRKDTERLAHKGILPKDVQGECGGAIKGVIAAGGMGKAISAFYQRRRSAANRALEELKSYLRTAQITQRKCGTGLQDGPE